MASELRDAHYTPDAVVDRMVEATLGPLLGGASFEQGASLTVLDPACGDGAFLLGAFRLLTRWLTPRAPAGLQVARHIAARQLHGVDIDPRALERARERLHRAAGADLPLALHEGDSLIEPGASVPPLGPDEPWRPFDYDAAFPTIFARARPGFDVVIGNPPYVDAEHMVAVRPGARAHCRRRYAAALGNWDLFCPFIERAVSLTRIGGRHAFLVPGQLASADYAAGARRILADRLRLESVLDYADAQLFDAAVYPLAYVGERMEGQERSGEVLWERVGASLEPGRQQAVPRDGFAASPWPRTALSAHLAAHLASKRWPRLGDVAEVSGAATVGEAYELLPLLREEPRPSAGDLRVINSGTIDPHRALWGERRMRYLRHRFDHPVVRRDDTAELPPRRLAQASSPKVVVASMTRRLEACVDPDGTVLAAKSTTVVHLDESESVDLWGLAALLNSEPMQRIYRELFGGLRLSGGYLPVGPRQLRALPLPSPSPQQNRILGEAARARAQRPDAQADTAIDAVAVDLFGIA